MSLDTTKTITSVTYNGIDIPLAGGGPSGSGQYTVTFLDYNGDIISQAKGNAGDHITIPTAPSHTGFTFTGWVSPLEGMDTIATNGYVTLGKADLAIGAAYSGDTQIEIELPLTGSSQEFRLGFNSSVPDTIDWGDGSTSSGSQIGQSVYHTYDITSTNKFTITISAMSTYGFRSCTPVITGLFVGSQVNDLGSYDSMYQTVDGIGFHQQNLKYVSFSTDISTYSHDGIRADGSFLNTGLETVIIPSGILSNMSSQTFQGCALIKYLVLNANMSNISSFGYSVGYRAPLDAALVVPRLVYELYLSSSGDLFGFSTYDFSSCSGIRQLQTHCLCEAAQKIKFPGSLEQIYGGINTSKAAYLKLLDFSELTSMPTFHNGDIYGTTVTTVIYIDSSSMYNPDWVDPSLLVVVPDLLYYDFNDTTTHPEWANLTGHFIRKSDYDALPVDVRP